MKLVPMKNTMKTSNGLYTYQQRLADLAKEKSIARSILMAQGDASAWLECEADARWEAMAMEGDSGPSQPTQDY